MLAPLRPRIIWVVFRFHPSITSSNAAAKGDINLFLLSYWGWKHHFQVKGCLKTVFWTLQLILCCQIVQIMVEKGHLQIMYLKAGLDGEREARLCCINSEQDSPRKLWKDPFRRQQKRRVVSSPTLSKTVKKWWSNAAQCCRILALLCDFHLQIMRLNYTYFSTHLNQCIKLIMHQRHTYTLGAAAVDCSDSFTEFLHSTGFFFPSTDRDTSPTN